MKLIALGHRRRVGKDTLANFMLDEGNKTGVEVYKVSFAHPLKIATHNLFGWAGMGNEYHYEICPEQREVILPAIGKSPRQLMIEFGLKMREIYPDLWVKLAMEEINSIAARAPKTAVIIVTDLRFPNEAKELSSHGAWLTKINRPSIPHSNDTADCALETYKNWNSIVENSGSLEDLREIAISMLRSKDLSR